MQGAPDNTARLATIRQLLEQRFKPRSLEVIDESHLHIGHAGARDGAGHFRLRIVADAFEGQSKVQRHRLVYQVLADLMPGDIHALGIEAHAGTETVPTPKT